MTASETHQHPYTWEQAIEILRDDPQHRELIFNAYLTGDRVGNCQRYAASDEFAEVLGLISQQLPNAHDVLDMPGGNGIATYAFANSGFDVTAIEPDGSDMVGRGAIRYVLEQTGLQARIVDAWGEAMPFPDASFDLVFVRQGLHHASDLKSMLAEIARVLRPGGALLACREHVVDNYRGSLKAFLASQADHQLYGGENAFTLPDYRDAITLAGLTIKHELGPYDTVINAFPNTPDVLRAKIAASRPGKLLCRLLSEAAVANMGIWYLRRRKAPGRLYSFLATKPAAV